MNRKRDWIFLEGLEARCVIGIYDWERKIRQKVQIDLELATDARRGARHDRVRDTVNYKAVAKRILQEIQKTRFRLVESLAEFIAKLLLKEFKFKELTVRVSKPSAIRGARTVGVQITRRRGALRGRI
jgi:dihydroneopterin aldolase